MRSLALITALLSLAACGSSSAKKAPVGGSCTPQAQGKSDECADRLCLALDSSSGVCTRDCSKDSICPDGFTCDTAGKFGRVCLKNRGCKTTNDCPAGHTCDAATSRCYIKVSRSLCAPCEDDAQCPAGGQCFTALGSGERFCTSPCSAGGVCADGFTCSSLPGGKTNQCVPSSGSCNFGKSLCQPCRGDNECGTALDLCVRNVVSGEQFCGKQCAVGRAGDCPNGFSCQDLKLDKSGKGPFQCVPDSNTCRGYCDSPDEHVQTLECGLGRTCDTAARQCQAAADGRMCAPCQTNDDCAKPGHANNQCIVNQSPNSPSHGETFCAEPCPAQGGDAVCLQNLGPGFQCQQVGNEHFCTPARGTCLAGLGRLGDDCSRNGTEDCVTGVCLVAGVNNLASICSATCAKDTDCGDSRYRCCDRVTDARGAQTYNCALRDATNTGPKSGAGVCAPPGGAFGDDCSPGRPPCTSGACLDLGTAQLCSQFCDTQGCPADFSCQSALNASDGTTQMVFFPTGGGVLGADCTFGPAACADRLCIKKDSGNVCTKACTAVADCPAGNSCDPTVTVDGQKLKVCLPPALQ